jgi:hypothetical protein
LTHCRYQDKGEPVVESIVTGDGNMGLLVHPKVRKKLHDLETSRTTKKIKIETCRKNNGDRVLGL